MAKRSNFIRTMLKAGLPLASIRVNLYTASTNTLATVYRDKTTASVWTNPFFTSSTGIMNFWANPGTYDVAIDDPTLARITARRLPWEAVSGDSEGLAGTQIDNNSGTTAKWKNYGLGASIYALNAVSTSHVQDGTIFLQQGIATRDKTADLPYCRLTRSGDFSPSGYGTFEWSSGTEQGDDMWNAGSPTKITIVTPGIYLIQATAVYSATEGTACQLDLRHSELLSGTVNIARKRISWNAIGQAHTISMFVSASAGDTITLYGSGTITTGSNMSATFLCGAP